MKKTIILLHGAFGAQSLLESLTTELSKDFEVFSFDFSGHGKMPFSDDGFGIEAFARELKDFITSNELTSPSIFGYSMGGYVALYLATTGNTEIDRIITLGTKFDWTPESAEHEVSKMNPELMEEKIPAYTELLNKRHHNWKELVYQTAAMMIDLGEAPPLNTETLTQIDIPVDILRGDQDHMVSQAESEAVSAQIRGASYSELSETPHPIEKVNPGKLAQKIRAILTE